MGVSCTSGGCIMIQDTIAFAALRAGGRPRGRIFGGTSRMGASRFGLGAHKRSYVRVVVAVMKFNTRVGKSNTSGSASG